MSSKHNGYRLQIHVRDGRVRLYTMNGADWSQRYPRIVQDAARLKAALLWMPRWSASTKIWFRISIYCMAALPIIEPSRARFDLLMLNGDDLRREPLRERKLALAKLLLRSLDGIQYVEHAEGHGDPMFEAVCKLGLEGIVSKRLTSVYRSGPSKAWLKIKNPKSAAATRAADGTF